MIPEPFAFETQRTFLKFLECSFEGDVKQVFYGFPGNPVVPFDFSCNGGQRINQLVIKQIKEDDVLIIFNEDRLNLWVLQQIQ